MPSVVAKPVFRRETTRLFYGDCRTVLPRLTGEYDLVFADPPFNIDQDYAGFIDNKSEAEYSEFTVDWMAECLAKLRPGGTFCINVPDAVVPLVLIVAISWKNLAKPADWIIWHYRFGQACKAATSSKCISTKNHLLVYVRAGGQRTWNPPMVPSDRATKYKDKRTQDSTTPGERVCFDVWGVEGDGPYWGRVQGNNSERWCIENGATVDHPNQLPEVYVARAIQAFSNPGDRVLCPFGGSGTETVVAQALQRQIDTIEVSLDSCSSIIKRIEKGAVRV